MAEGFFNQMVEKNSTLAGRWEAISAGTHPGEEVNPVVLQAMASVGINLDPQKHHPKPLNDDLIRQLGPNVKKVVVACNDQCILPPEIPPGVPRDTWDLPDPNGQPYMEVIRVRVLVKDRVEHLLKELSRA